MQRNASGLDRRLYIDPDAVALGTGPLDLPAGAARHVQVWRLQPGDAITLFDGGGREWPARIEAMGRSQVSVAVGEPVNVSREPQLALTLAVVVPAGDRMDALIEKATELGAARIAPLHSQRSVLRLPAERAAKRAAHWQAIAIAAAEQSGRAHLPQVAPVQELLPWLRAEAEHASPALARGVLSLADDALALAQWQPTSAAVVLSGPEGGFTLEEERAARGVGFSPIGLGPRVLRADTAPLAALAALVLR